MSDTEYVRLVDKIIDLLGILDGYEDREGMVGVLILETVLGANRKKVLER